MVKETVPVPVPLLPPANVIQEALLFTVQAQPAAVVTFIMPVPPVVLKFWLDSVIEYVQFGTGEGVGVAVGVGVGVGTVFAFSSTLTSKLSGVVFPFPIIVIFIRLSAS